MSRIRVGIFGVGRGMDLAENLLMLNCDIVAICDFNAQRLEKANNRLCGTAKTYTNFYEFINHKMDAVILANYFHEHAPFAIECFKRGIHVFSECISNGTMAEGVELIRAFENSNSIYMLGENYPNMKFNREIKRICDGGSLGKILYAEGEYNHTVDPFDLEFKKSYNYFEKHWRNFNPRTYYLTHSLGPIMAATGATPKRVTAFAAFEDDKSDIPTASYVGDKVAIITTQNNDGSVFRVTGCAAFGGDHNSYRVCGSRGQVENLRGMGNQIMLRYSQHTAPAGQPAAKLYEPAFNDSDTEMIEKSGHGGADYLTLKQFINCINNKMQPCFPFDIYSATVMSSVAILSHRSMLEGGCPYDIPDFKEEKWRKVYENDRLCPYYGGDGKAPTQPCCSKTDYEPTENQLKLYREMLGLL